MPRITAVSGGDPQNSLRLERGPHTRELWNLCRKKKYIFKIAKLWQS